MRLPCVERVRRPQDGAVALDRLDLAGDRGDDAVADLVKDKERIVELLIEHFGPDDARGARLGELDRHGEALAVALQRPADDVVHVQHPAGLFRADVALVQGEHGALRDHEQAAQLGEPGDHVVRERIGDAAAGGARRRTGRRTASPRWRRGVRAAIDDVGATAVRCGASRRRGVRACGASACARAARHASRIGAQSRPSASNSRAVAARCSSPSRIRPRRASAFSRISCTRRSNGASSSHFSRYPSASSSETLRDEMLQHRSVAAAEPAALRDEPAVEARIAVDLQSFEQLAVEQRGQRAQPLGRQRRDALAGGTADLDRIDEAVREIEPDGVGLGIDAPPARLVEDAPRPCSGTSAARRADRSARPTAVRTAGCA